MNIMVSGQPLRDESGDYNPPWLLKNRHVQSLLASSKLRKPKLVKQAAKLIDCQREVILPAGEGVRLHSLVSEHDLPGNLLKHSRPLVILIHGWEGSAESIYLLSAAATLFNAGFDVIRLHLRDHGPSHHLNRELFHAARIDEVVNACQAINVEFPRDRVYLAGFSLGGNFALRVATHARSVKLKLDHVVAISPVINPMSTMEALEQGWSAYRRYFIKKWRNSLKKKEEAFPDLVDSAKLLINADLSSLTDDLIKNHTEFNSKENYFNSYALVGDKLATIDVPTDIITSADDPVIPAADFLSIRPSRTVRCRILANGGHCGFIKDGQLNSWIDDELLRLFSSPCRN